jgi:tetrahydromethanopterin S-methyltransferase subunit C
VYKEKKSIDVTPYLESISLSGKTILIKTKKPIINTELSNIIPDISAVYTKRLLKMGIRMMDMKLKFY